MSWIEIGNFFSFSIELKMFDKLAIPIIYTLLWSEYNYHHALELIKSLGD